MLIEEGQAAFSQGRVRQGLADFARYDELAKPSGFVGSVAPMNALLLHDMGLDDLARQQLAKVPAGYDSSDYRQVLAQFGDAGHALALLNGDLRKSPTDTLLTRQSAPEVRAGLAMHDNQPKAAIEALKPALPIEMRTFDVPYLRAKAYLQANDGAHAAVEFHKILDNRGAESVSVHYALSHLGLARALRLTHDNAGARKAYEQFFADWSGADPGLPLLSLAHAEHDRLPR
jgi:predicted Zn-dependent protease